MLGFVGKGDLTRLGEVVGEKVRLQGQVPGPRRVVVFERLPALRDEVFDLRDNCVFVGRELAFSDAGEIGFSVT
jgi:hypothetical protein